MHHFDAEAGAISSHFEKRSKSTLRKSGQAFLFFWRLCYILVLSVSKIFDVLSSFEPHVSICVLACHLYHFSSYRCGPF